MLMWVVRRGGGGVVDVAAQYDVSWRHFILLQRLLDIVLGYNLL